MNETSLFFAIVGVALSIYAVVKARSALAVAKSVVSRTNEQADTTRVRRLLEKLDNAKKATLRRRPGAPSDFAAGYTEQGDVALIQQAQDALRTELPIGLTPSIQTAARNAAEELEVAFQHINDPNSQGDGWAEALQGLQAVIPKLENEERRLNNAVILGT